MSEKVEDRALAERLAAEVYDDAVRSDFVCGRWTSQPPSVRTRAINCVLAGLASRTGRAVAEVPEKVDLLTADGSMIRHFVECVAPLAKHETAGPNPNHAHLRDEIVRQCNASRWGRAPTEAEVAVDWDATMADTVRANGFACTWSERSTGEHTQLLAFARRIAARSAPASRGVDPTYKQESEAAWAALGSEARDFDNPLALAGHIKALAGDLDAVRREAARKAWDAAKAYWGHLLISQPASDAPRDRYLAATYPARDRVVTCAICKQPGADPSTGQHATRDECIEALGVALAAARVEGNQS